ncbi:MAG: ribosome biogenesis GTPase Der [Patescibacteria group bacterium]|nr:ribosome biogenesis GTPase Der [Patescibacteria group bacterium]MDD5121332.1 ribosome biogenesis GTPase Der [Patescibacteria group bacterium]MDD5221817.1 ribosome biogenesis GTPase Der [Patescibacteria group bacterium]MDD5395749.1 ribosome biogenesis GTPase Der [Patescibacteria group bacterium]
MAYPKVVLVGQINAGKSSLFNRIISRQKALVSKTPGTTRDRNYAESEWQGKKFTLVDSAGFEKRISLAQDSLSAEYSSILQQAIKKQIELAIAEADLILFLIDIQQGTNQLDIEMAKMIKKNKKPVILVLNKADSSKWVNEANDSAYWNLGLGEPRAVSAVTGLGIGDLLDEVAKKIKRGAGDKKNTMPAIRVAIAGRPNVGKSSLINAILGEERVIVSPVAHTTREPQDTLFYFNDKPIVFIDTAGIRKKSKVKPDIEKTGVLMSLKAIRKADIIVLVLDISEKISHQDKALVDLIVEAGRGLILAINKIDLENNFNNKFEKFIEYYQWNLPGASWAPIIFISTKTKQNVNEILNLIECVETNRQRKISEKDLTDFIKQVVLTKKFRDKWWAQVKFTQIDINPPQFLLLIPPLAAKRKLLSPAQLAIIEKSLRQKWSLEGTSIKISTGVL